MAYFCLKWFMDNTHWGNKKGRKLQDEYKPEETE